MIRGSLVLFTLGLTLGLLLFAVMTLLAVYSSSGGTQVDFSQQEPAVARTEAPSPVTGALRLAAAPIMSPQTTSTLYQGFADYLGEKLGRPVELVQGKTYAEVNDLVKSGDVTLALVCTNPYLEGQEEFGMELLVVPQVNGDTVYYSLLIAGADAEAYTLAGLRGASFAFTDPLSNSGRLVPLYQLALLGERPDSFFGRTTFTYSHDSSIHAVAEGIVTAAAVDSLVFDHLLRMEPALAEKIKVIERWGPYGINPFVVNPNLDPQLKDQLRQLFLEMGQDPQAEEILRPLAIDRFVVPDDSIYDSVRQMRAYLQEHWAPAIR